MSFAQRHFGSWPPSVWHHFSAEQQQAFFKMRSNKKSDMLRALQTLSRQRNENKKTNAHREHFKPLSVWERPFWGFDMRRPLQPLVIASDASTSFGLAVSVAELDVDHVRRLARLDTKAGHHVVLGDGDAPPDKDRVGKPHDLGLRMTDFATVLSVRAPEEHVNIMEGKAFLAALR